MRANDAEATRSGTWLYWVALAVALSPSIVDAARLAIAEWWARGSLLVAVLAVSCMLRPDERGPRRPLLGGALVALAVAATLVAAGGGMTRLARPAIPLGVLGMALAMGRPSPRSAALLFFAVAPPRALMDRLPGLHELAGPQALLASPDGGLPLFWLLLGLGACAGVRNALPLRAVASRAIRCGLWAIPVQLAALLAASLLWQAELADAARLLLSSVWGPCAAVALLLQRGVRARPSDV